MPAVVEHHTVFRTHALSGQPWKAAYDVGRSRFVVLQSLDLLRLKSQAAESVAHALEVQIDAGQIESWVLVLSHSTSNARCSATLSDGTARGPITSLRAIVAFMAYPSCGFLPSVRRMCGCIGPQELVGTRPGDFQTRRIDAVLDRELLHRLGTTQRKRAIVCCGAAGVRYAR